MADRDDQLREMAEHRGLRLVRSRRRKPGVGDYGRYGLNDSRGQPLLGIGDDGLTATAEDIEAYLRRGAIATWQTSAATTKANPKPKAKRPPEPLPPERKPRAARPSPAAPAAPRGPSPKPARAAQVKPARTAAPKPAPALKLRPAARGDAAAVAGLIAALGGKLDTAEAASRIAALRAPGGVIVADRGEVIGCVSWAVTTTLQHGAIGRIGAIVVADKERRRGVGRQLLEAALAALAKHGCTTVEAMSDIAIRNAHNFFRATGFAQVSYRFTRAVAQ